MIGAIKTGVKSRDGPFACTCCVFDGVITEKEPLLSLSSFSNIGSGVGVPVGVGGTVSSTCSLSSVENPEGWNVFAERLIFALVI